jgi:hypothetical protein
MKNPSASLWQWDFCPTSLSNIEGYDEIASGPVKLSFRINTPSFRMNMVGDYNLVEESKVIPLKETPIT